MMRRLLASALVGIATVTTVGAGLVAPAAAAPGLAPPSRPAACSFAPSAPPAASGYSTDEKASPYSTPAPANHIAILNAFSSLPRSILAQNLSQAVAINHAATSTVAQAAVDDNYNIGGPAIFNALGSRLSPAFFAALKAGELPKTSALLIGDDSIAGKRITTTAEKKYFQYPRPFEVAPQLIRHYGDGRPDLYAAVRGSGSYPSGHTTWGYAEAFLIAALVPEVGPQLLSRAAEYGNHRIVLGVHYPLDVIGGRITGEAIAAELLADQQFARLLGQARAELRATLQARVGAPIARVVACQQPFVSTPVALAGYRSLETYAFGPSGDTTRPIEVPVGAENLIRAAHPGLSTVALRRILARTSLPSGYPLDKSGPTGGWQRLDIARAWVTR